jgi:hypothetical protein
MFQYKILQQMLLSVTDFCNKNLQYEKNERYIFLFEGQWNKEFLCLLKVYTEYKNESIFKNTQHFINDFKNLMLFVEQKHLLNFTSFRNLEGFKTSFDIKGFENELDLLLKGDVVIDINYKKLFTFYVERDFITRILLLAELGEVRNLENWKILFKEKNYFKLLFKEHFIKILEGIKYRQSLMSISVKIEHHYDHANINLNGTIKYNLVHIFTSPIYNFKNNPEHLEICYLSDNLMFSRSNYKDQHNIKCATFLELNVLPYCFYNNILLDSHAISVYGLYKCNHVYIKNQEILTSEENPARLGNVLLVNKFPRKVNRDAIIDVINAYHKTCNYLNVNRRDFILVGDYMAYEQNYKLAALDFIILIFVCSVTNRSLRYNMLETQAPMFEQLKSIVCQLTAEKLYTILTTSYDVNIEPSDNFKHVLLPV